MPVWDQIGSEQFLALAGEVDPKAIKLVDITRKAVNGIALRQDGIRGTATQLHTIVDVGGNTAAAAKIATYKGMIGNIVTIKLRGVDYANYIVIDAQPVNRKALANSLGGIIAGTYLVEMNWTVQYAGT